jgi:hypothetical protein
MDCHIPLSVSNSQGKIILLNSTENIIKNESLWGRIWKKYDIIGTILRLNGVLWGIHSHPEFGPSKSLKNE